ncbi:MAG: hypothetical protein H7249_20945 [Chitinophagaceae bacterium]|nr:hypothetical protein [Oligoflexus sp.]
MAAKPDGTFLSILGTNIYSYNAGTNLMDDIGDGKEVAAGGSTIWAIDLQDRVMRYNGTGWDLMGSAIAKKIAVDNTGAAWIMQSDGTLYKWNGTQFNFVTGTSLDISISAFNQVFILGEDHDLYEYIANTWVRRSWNADLIAIGAGRFKATGITSKKNS